MSCCLGEMSHVPRNSRIGMIANAVLEAASGT